MTEHRGTAASPGIAVGPAYVYRPEEPSVPRYTCDDPEAEWTRIEDAAEAAEEQLSALRARTAEEVGEEAAQVFDAHILILKDPELLQTLGALVREQRMNAEAAVEDAVEQFAAMLDAMDDEYFRQRAVDLRDVKRRLLRNLQGMSGASLAEIPRPSVVVAHDLTPSDTAQLAKDMTLGFCTAVGGPTSHTAIIARMLGLPAVVGVGSSLMSVADGEEVVLDGEEGLVIRTPDAEQREDYLARAERWRAERVGAQRAAQALAHTADGKRVEVVANIGDVASARTAIEFGGEGVGLLRTEFLYLGRDIMPDEEEQYEAYRAIAGVIGARPLVVRTLDIGGDKQVPYLEIGQEMNPFLGWRAVRLSLSMRDMFKAQLRAILRAAPGHDIRIMFPMISGVEEFRQATSVYQEAHAELTAGGLDVPAVEVGMMVEVPSAVVMADALAREADFFSIGTNDLIQYSMAVDRGNEKVSYLYEPLHPAVLRQVAAVVQAGHGEGIWVGMCGEMAGDLQAIPLLIGLGLDELSMNPTNIPAAKALIARVDSEDARRVAAQALQMDTAASVRALLADAAQRLGWFPQVE